MENNNTKEIDLIALAKIVWIKRKRIALWGIIGLVFGVIISISIPKEYTSHIKVAPEGSGKDASGTSGIAAMIGVNLSNGSSNGVNEDLYPEIISSTPFLIEFADLDITYKGEQMPMYDYILNHQRKPWWSYVMSFPGQIIGWVMSIGQDKADTLTIKNSPEIQYAFTCILSGQLEMDNDVKKGIITIKSTFQDPDISKMILDTLVVKLEEYMNNYSTARTQSNLESNLKMLEEAREKYYQSDDLYAQAQDRNQNLIYKSATVKLDRLQNERDLAFQVYQQLAMQVETDKIKLQEQRSIVTIIEPVSTPTAPSAPRTLMIIIACSVLSVFIKTTTTIIRILISTNKYS